MAATKQDLIGWFERGVKSEQSYMVVVCDTYDHSDYPCYFQTPEAAIAKMKNPGEMQRVMECYNLHGDMDTQMNQYRAMALKY